MDDHGMPHVSSYDARAEAEKNAKHWADYQERMDAESMKQGGAWAELAMASRSARNSIKENGLSPSLDDDGQYVYTQSQGDKAACHAREDAAATLILQKMQLDHLHRLSGVNGLLWICIGLLAYIAYKLS